MPSVIDPTRSPFGLSGGTFLTGSQTVSSDAFWYYAVSQSVATLRFSNLQDISGSQVSMSITLNAGASVYGNITSVTQSNGMAILYSGSANPTRYTF